MRISDWSSDGCSSDLFTVTDGDAQMPVVYTGILQDLFRENQAVIAPGRMQGDTFVAEQVLAKHDEPYVPKDGADTLGLAQKNDEGDTTADRDAAQGLLGPCPGLPAGGTGRGGM